MSHAHLRPARSRASSRGKYAKFSDVQFLASVMQQEQASHNSTGRLMFLIDGKRYHRHEVMRRLRRAQKAGTLSMRESTDASALPNRIQIVQRTIGRPCTTPGAGYIPDQDSESEIYTKCAALMDEVSRRCFLQLIDMEYDTSLLTTPSDTDEYSIKAKFFFNIIKYFRGAHGNGHFVHNDLGEYVSHVSPTSIVKINDFYKCCITAIDLIERGYHIQGFALVSDSLWLMEQLLEERDPKLIDTICDVSVLLLTRGWNRMYEVLNERICAIVELRAVQKKEEHQPWAQMFDCLKRLPTSQALELMQRGWKCGYDQLEGIFPGHAWDGLNISCSPHQSLRMGQHFSQLYHEILSTPVASPRRNKEHPNSASDIQRQFTRAKVRHSLGGYHAALEDLDMIVSKCSKARKQGENKWMALEVEALEVSARCHYAISGLVTACGGPSTAETLLKTAITRSTTLWGGKSATTIALKHTLWSWCLEQGQFKEAELLRLAIDAVVVKIEP